jgi:hypothetical protein
MGKRRLLFLLKLLAQALPPGGGHGRLAAF